MRNILKEWTIDAPWGKIAAVSWGDPAGKPVLLVHGREDSLSTFIPLLEHLPDTHHYVGFDLPGHGKSDAFPIGVTLLRIHFVTSIDVVVTHLGWNQFYYVAHSLGSELGLYYNAIRPHRITKFVHIDVVPGLQNNQLRPFPEYYERFYENYYSNYEKCNEDKRVYSERRALDAVMKARGLSEEQARLILQRNLNSVGEDTYRLSWDRRLKHPGSLNQTNDALLKIFTKNSPPTLFIRAKSSRTTYLKGKMGADNLIKDLEKNTKNFQMLMVEGTHDVHLTHPERISGDITKFLEKDFGIKSKL